MNIFTPWGTQQDPTPIRSWIGKNIPGAQGLGDLIGSVPISPYGIGPTWKDFSNSNIQIGPPPQAKAEYTPDPFGNAIQSPARAPSSPGGPTPTGSGNGNGGYRPPTNVPPQQTGVPSPDLGMFDQLIGPALQSLEASVPAANSAYDAAVANTNAQVDKQVGTAKQNTATTQNQLNQRQTGAENTTANAVDEARRGFSEMSQGLQSRYGGSTGTGAFAESILGAQTQKNIAGYRNQLMQSIQQIEDTRTQVKTAGDQMLQDLEAQRQATLKQHKADLDNAIANIRARQGDLQSRKAELVANAIQQYQAAVYQANNLSNQFAQKLSEQQQQADLQLRNALATQSDKVQKLELVTDKLTGSPVGVFNPTTGGYKPYGGEQTTTPGGNIMPGAGQDLTKGTDQQGFDILLKNLSLQQ